MKNLQAGNARFETARFIGKAIMVDDDATKVRFKEDDVFKAVTGGGLSPVERKGIDGTDYMITAKIIANVNEMPIFNSGGAITRRLHIIKTVAPMADKGEIDKRNQMFPEEKLQEEIPLLIPYTVEMFQKAMAEDWKIDGDISEDMVATDPFDLWHKTLESGEFKAHDLYSNYFAFFETLNLGDDAKPMTQNAWGRKMSNWHKKIKHRSGIMYQV